MLDTTTNTTTTTTTAIMLDSLVSHQDTKIEKYTCSLCASKFVNCEEQRAHFKCAWHICNLHRKLESQSPITEKDYQESLSRSSPSRKARVQEGWNEQYPTRQYVVLKKARHISPESSTGDSSEAGESSGSQGDPSDSNEEEEESGASESESETSDTLDEAEDATATASTTWRDETEMRLSSGKIISTKSHPRARKKHTQHHADPPIPNHNNPTPDARTPSPSLTLAYLASTSSTIPLDKRISRRDAMGIVGLSDPERKALLATERKMVSMETRAKGGWEGSVDTKGNCQKHYRIGGSRGGKKMGGLEKRLG